MAPRWEYLLICGLPAAEVAYTNKDSVIYAVDIGPVAPRAVNRWEAGLLLRLVSEKIVLGTWYLVLGTWYLDGERGEEAVVFRFSLSAPRPHSIDQGWYRFLTVNCELRTRRPYPLNLMVWRVSDRSTFYVLRSTSCSTFYVLRPVLPNCLQREGCHYCGVCCFSTLIARARSGAGLGVCEVTNRENAEGDGYPGVDLDPHEAF